MTTGILCDRITADTGGFGHRCAEQNRSESAVMTCSSVAFTGWQTNPTGYGLKLPRFDGHVIFMPRAAAHGSW